MFITGRTIVSSTTTDFFYHVMIINVCIYGITHYIHSLIRWNTMLLYIDSLKIATWRSINEYQLTVSKMMCSVIYFTIFFWCIKLTHNDHMLWQSMIVCIVLFVVYNTLYGENIMLLYYRHSCRNSPFSNYNRCHTIVNTIISKTILSLNLFIFLYTYLILVTDVINLKN